MTTKNQERAGNPPVLHRFAIDNVQLRIAADGTPEGIVSGRAVPFNTITDRAGYLPEMIGAGAVRNDPTGLPLRAEHDETIGVILSGETRDDGYYITAQILDTQRGRETITLLAGGAVKSFSIGFFGHDYQDMDVAPYLRVWSDIELFEVSVVSVPAYPTAEVLGFRSVDSVRPAADLPAPSEPETREAHPTTEEPTPADDAPAADTTDTADEELAADTTPTSELLETQENTMDQEIRSAIDALREDIKGLDNTEIRDALDELTRKVAAPVVSAEPKRETRTAGELLRAIVKGDQDALDSYNRVQERAYTGGTMADTATQNTWVGDLTRLIDRGSPLADFFASGTLPSEGNTVEYAVLDTNTLQVAKQANEGDKLAFGKVSQKTETADVLTFGGYSTLSRQAIERSNPNITDTTLRGLAIAAGQSKKQLLRDGFSAARDAQAAKTGANAYKVSVPSTNAKVVDYVSAAVDAAILMDANGLALEAMIVPPDEYKLILAMTDSTGRPMFTVVNDGVNSYGVANPKAFTAELANIVVLCDPGLATGKSAFVNSLALRFLSTNGVSLSSDDITTLTRDFSLYFYGALLTEIPAGVVPVVKA